MEHKLEIKIKLDTKKSLKPEDIEIYLDDKQMSLMQSLFLTANARCVSVPFYMGFLPEDVYEKQIGINNSGWKQSLDEVNVLKSIPGLTIKHETVGVNVDELKYNINEFFNLLCSSRYSKYLSPEDIKKIKSVDRVLKKILKTTQSNFEICDIIA